MTSHRFNLGLAGPYAMKLEIFVRANQSCGEYHDRTGFPAMEFKI